MKTKLIAATVIALVISAAWLWPRGQEVQAQAKVEKIANLDEFLKADEAYGKMDLAAKCDYITNLADKEKRIDWNQKKWMQYRILMDQAKKDGIDKDPVKLLAWVAGIYKDYKNPIQKSSYYALDAIVVEYGTRRLYADETYSKADIKGKLKRLKELWTAREMGQSATYEINDCLVFQYLAPAGGKIDDELKLMGELVAADVTVWDTTASIQHGLVLRALYEKPELSDNFKRMKWLGEITDSKSGKLSWMIAGEMRISLLMEMITTDDEFVKLNYADRAAKLDAWAKDGFISTTDATSIKAAFCAAK